MGELKYHNNIPLVENFAEMKQVMDGWNIRNYLGSLRDYWIKNYRKRIIRPKLKVRESITKLVFDFDQYIKPRLSKIIEFKKGMKEKTVQRYIDDINNYLKWINDKVKGLVREGLQINRFRGKK